MKAKWFKAFSVVIVLVLAIVPVAGASDGGTEVFPLEPVIVDETGGMVNDTPTAWFVEFASPPVAEGGAIAKTKADKTNFRNVATQNGLQFTERRNFDTLWNGMSITIKPQDLNRLRTLPGVQAIYPVGTTRIPETQTADPELFTALTMTGADVAQSELGYTGAGVKVAVMDTGIDYDHPDLGGCFGPGCRVVTGYDFVGDDYNADDTSPSYNPVPVPDPDPDDCNGHGTHVSGIVGANGTVTGVAPGVTFGAYRVFGCEGSTTDDIMLAAMERILADDMDVLNMSIGDAYGWPQYPTAQASDRLVKKGIVVVASIGNNGANGLYAAGAPGLGKDVIGVASFDNTSVFLTYFEVNGRHIGYVPMTFAGPTPTTGSAEIVYVGRGCADGDLVTPGAQPDPYLADPSGKVALISRGTCGFGEKAARAIGAGAVAVVIHNNVPGVFNGTLGAPIDGVTPVVGISLADGQFIQAQTAPVTMTWTDQQESFPSPTAGLISSFSSYGLAPDLSLKPDIGAPGGNIYSTYPLEAGGYATISGTSMSSPHVAGAAALLLEAKPKTKARDVRGLLQNSADPQVWSLNPGLGFLDHVHRQGAGMLDIDDAILATTVITPSKIATGEYWHVMDPAWVQPMDIRNNSHKPVTYDITYENALSTSGVISPGFWDSDAYVTFSETTITVPKFNKYTITAYIHAATYPVNGMYGGYIVFTPRNGGQIYRVPYAGFVGDYQGIQALTPTTNGFPWLAISYLGDFYGPIAGPADWVYSMVGEDVPYILAHFDHQVQLVHIHIFKADGTPVHKTQNFAFAQKYFPRNSTTTSFFAFPWDGTRSSENGRVVRTLPDGQYYLELEVLKAGGDPGNPAHWETWNSPIIEIDRP
jgi:subtilisin family serine protease